MNGGLAFTKTGIRALEYAGIVSRRQFAGMKSCSRQPARTQLWWMDIEYGQMREPKVGDRIRLPNSLIIHTVCWSLRESMGEIVNAYQERKPPKPVRLAKKVRVGKVAGR